MTTAEIRDSFLKFFQAQGHEIVVSSSLIPGDDPTLLFANSGMVQFKDCFLGTDKRGYSRATTCQKCLRISGKHNDLENVGRTARHHTFFEMLGNFSFGDYFKKEAIKFGWGFLTDVLKLQKDRLWVTVFEEDDEAAKLWRDLTDVMPERILRCGKEDNFWAMGETGPCGPCSEIHYFLGDDVSQQSEEAFRKNDGTYIEIWNLVFMQFNRDVSGKMTPLPKPSVDTGMGLERVAAVKQGKLANFDNDLLRDIIRKTETLSGKKYDGRDYRERDPIKDQQYGYDVAFRVVADHVRACSFLIADGIMPSSDGRGYILRRLLRRACRHGRVLGFTGPFLNEVSREVVLLMSGVYPELKANEEKIRKIIHVEEEKFLQTLDSGLSLLKKGIGEVKEKGARTLSGELAFLLHDTYGFPLDLTEDIIRLDGLTVDRRAFDEQMEAQRERSRSARNAEADLILQRTVKPLPTKFVGYEFSEYEAKIAGLFTSEGEVKLAKAGTEVALITEETPFYGESGGQIGDTGAITANGGVIEVLDTQKVGGETIVHICRVVEGEVGTGNRVRLAVDDIRRKKLRMNHSATHLVQLALREVLGDHVKQAGSRVSDNGLRFDFNHFEGLTAEQLEEVENIVNDEIRANHPVVTQLTGIEEAKKSGATALFGEKYGSVVRVVQIGPRSLELCGGTHVARSGDIGVLSLVGESAISAGVRRVEAVSGPGALSYTRKGRSVLGTIAGLLKSSEGDLESRVKRILERNRELEKEISRLSQSSKTTESADLSQRAVTTARGLKIVASVLDHADPKRLREIADELKVRLRSGCIALGSVVDGKVIMLTAVTDDLTDRYHAGKLVDELSKVLGGKGGGRADLAQAGGGDPAKLDLALKRFQELVS